MCAGGGHVCQGVHAGGVYVQGACMQENCPLKWAVRILLECTLFCQIVTENCMKMKEIGWDPSVPLDPSMHFIFFPGKDQIYILRLMNLR